MTNTNAPTILCVDDLEDNLDLLTEVFEDEPYTVITALDATTAFKHALESGPELAILDVAMPDIDGYELCRWFRAHPATARLPVIFLTAQCTSGPEVVRGLDTGACDYVVKPFSAEELRARVRAVLRDRAQHALDVRAGKRVARRLLGY
jgi:DNA-binding response OmpR family regulator